MDKRKVLWVAEDGSIFTVEPVATKLERRTVKVRESIAFNLRKDIAEHIVRLHNESLKVT